MCGSPKKNKSRSLAEALGRNIKKLATDALEKRRGSSNVGSAWGRGSELQLPTTDQVGEKGIPRRWGGELPKGAEGAEERRQEEGRSTAPERQGVKGSTGRKNECKFQVDSREKG